MAEIGTVKEVKGKELVISMQRQEACGKCRACIQGMQEQEMIMNAENRCGATVGQKVEVMLEESQFLKAVFIMYGIPLIALLAGLALGYVASGESEVVAMISGFVALAITYGLIRSQEKRFKTKSYQPVAFKIVEE